MFPRIISNITKIPCRKNSPWPFMSNSILNLNLYFLFHHCHTLSCHKKYILFVTKQQDESDLYAEMPASFIQNVGSCNPPVPRHQSATFGHGGGFPSGPSYRLCTNAPKNQPSVPSRSRTLYHTLFCPPIVSSAVPFSRIRKPVFAGYVPRLSVDVEGPLRRRTLSSFRRPKYFRWLRTTTSSAGFEGSGPK